MTVRAGLSETDIHRRVVAYLRRDAPGVAFFHCPNEGKRGPKARSLLHGMGVSRGVPDLLFVTPPPNVVRELPLGRLVPAPGAALELKSDTGRLEPEQRAWLETLDANGWATAWTRGLDAALEQLVAWGYLPARVLAPRRAA